MARGRVECELQLVSQVGVLQVHDDLRTAVGVAAMVAR